MKTLTNDSYWTLTTPDVAYQPLTESCEADVAIIGGGLTGLHTALKILEDEPAQRIVIVEADRICCDASGRTMGKVATSHSRVFARLSEETGKAYAKANEEGFARILCLIEKYRIDCNLSRVANYVFASTASKAEQIKKEYEAMVRSGLSVEWVEPRNKESQELPLEFVAGIRQGGQAVYHPRKFALGLAEAIRRLGGSIHEHTPAVGLEEHDSGVSIDIGGGKTIEAKKAIVATRVGLPGDESFVDSLVPWRGHRAAFSFEESPVKNAYLRYEPPVKSFRADEQYLIVGGGDGSSLPFEDRRHYEAIDAWVKHAYPKQSAPDAQEKACFWWGEDEDSTDMLPLVGTYREGSKHVFMAAGFCGWGMTKAAFAAIMLADLVAGRGSSYQTYFNPWRF